VSKNRCKLPIKTPRKRLWDDNKEWGEEEEKKERM
jgi:hypothetical protein